LTSTAHPGLIKPDQHRLNWSHQITVHHITVHQITVHQITAHQITVHPCTICSTVPTSCFKPHISSHTLQATDHSDFVSSFLSCMSETYWTNERNASQATSSHWSQRLCFLLPVVHVWDLLNKWKKCFSSDRIIKGTDLHTNISVRDIVRRPQDQMLRVGQNRIYL